MEFCSSDYHWKHRNIIRYCGRPFKTLDEMHTAIIKSHNDVVGPEDTFRFLGDFGFCGIKMQEAMFQKLNGKKKIIHMGNHDKKKQQYIDMGWDEVYDHGESIDIFYKNIKFRFSHYPFSPYDHTIDKRYMSRRPDRKGCSWLICGHVHEKWAVLDNMVNVGWDVWRKPISMDHIVKIIKVVEGKEEDEELLNYIYNFKTILGIEQNLSKEIGE